MRNTLSYSPEVSTQRYANRACSKPHPIPAIQACWGRTWIARGADRAAPSPPQAFLLTATPLRGTAAPQRSRDRAASPGTPVSPGSPDHVKTLIQRSPFPLSLHFRHATPVPFVMGVSPSMAALRWRGPVPAQQHQYRVPPRLAHAGKQQPGSRPPGELWSSR